MRSSTLVAAVFVALAALAPGLIAVTQPSLTSCLSINGPNATPYLESFSTIPSLTPVNTIRLINTVMQDSKFVAQEKGSCFEYGDAYETGPVASPNLLALLFYHYGNQTWRPCGIGPPTRVILDRLQVTIPIVAGVFNEKALEISDLGPPTVWFCPGIPSP